MSNQGLRTTFNKVGKTANNLLTADPSEMPKYKMGWAPPTWMGNEKKEHTKGIWNDGVRTCVFPLIGMVDADKTNIGDYGNCWYDKSKGIPPSRAALAKSKFTIALKAPERAPDLDSDLVDATINQMLCLDAIEENANDALNGAAEDSERISTTDWVRFEEIDGNPVGHIHATIGPVYESKVKKIRGRDIKKGSMGLTQVAGAIEKEDIVNDSMDFLGIIRNHGLKHNEKLPCYLPNGERIGRAPQDLRRELYHGRWVKMDVELLMWNMRAEGKRIFQLSVVRLDVLPALDIAGPADAPFTMASYNVGKGITIPDIAKVDDLGVKDAETNNVKGGTTEEVAPEAPAGDGVETVKATEQADGRSPVVEKVAVEGDLDSEATLSDASKKENDKKRAAVSQGGRARKSAKQT